MDDDLLERAFAAGAKSINIMKIGRTYHATLGAWRDLDSDDGIDHTEHASAKGEGRTPSLAMRDAIARLRPTPAIEVREIKPVNGRRIVPLALAESTTRIKGLLPASPTRGPAGPGTACRKHGSEDCEVCDDLAVVDDHAEESPSAEQTGT